MRTSSSLALLPVLLLATDVAAATRTTLSFGDVPAQARYSQAIDLELTLDDSTGAPLAGDEGCDPDPDDASDIVCAVIVTLARDDAPTDIIQVTAPDIVVDAAGRARVRITLVDGRHGDATFIASAEGTPYTITARFPGNGPLATDVDCRDGTGTADGLQCPSTATASFLLIPEVPGLTFNQDVVMNLGESVTLSATLRDDTGDADIAGSDVDGSAPRDLAELPIRFFYDKDDNGRPSSSELIGEGVTNDRGIATIVFNALPPDVQAGIFDAGLQAEFPGDDRYALARTSVSLTVNSSGAPDLARTIVEVTPEVIAVGENPDAVVRVRLVDVDNNILGPDAAAHDVVITTDLGRMLDTVRRDPLDGSYKQTISAALVRGTATVSVTVDGEPAGSTTLTVDGAEGCTCSSGSAAAPGLVVLGLLALRRRRRR